MVKLVSDYQRGTIALAQLVGELQGALDAGDFRDEVLVRRWYELWTPLETYIALKRNGVDPAEMGDDVDAKLAHAVEVMHCFLVEQLNLS